jgi:hypothetical protein
MFGLLPELLHPASHRSIALVRQGCRRRLFPQCDCKPFYSRCDLVRSGGSNIERLGDLGARGRGLRLRRRESRAEAGGVARDLDTYRADGIVSHS